LSVRQALERQSATDQRAAALVPRAAGKQEPSPLPISHPLCFDWRFTDETNDQFIRLLAHSTEAGAVIGYCGSPTTWRAARRSLPDRRHVLLDSEAARYASIDGQDNREGEAYTVTIGREPLPALAVNVTVVDPPWYPEYHEAFLAASACLLTPGGVVHASFPPPLTRPGVLAERAIIVENALRAGLMVEEVSPLALRYQTPPFEVAAYAAAGLAAVPSAWRRGDLLTLRKHDSASGAPAPPVPDEGWVFVTIDEIPIAVRPAVASAGALLEPAIAGATLPTVSRRHSARARAMLWSSRNRIYRSCEPALVTAVVVGLAEGIEPATIAAAQNAKEELGVRLAKRINDLVLRERKEHGLD
jgi:hypothetical protein